MNNAALNKESHRWRSQIHIVVWLLAYKVLFFSLIYLAVVLLPPMFNYANYYFNTHLLPEPPRSMERFFSTWDTQIYLIISQFGYQAISPETSPINAAFPLWPFCIRLFSYLVGGNYFLSGLILANILSILALIALYEYISREKDPHLADRTILLLLAFPGAIFLTFPYSEALFLLLSVLIFRQLSKHNYVKTGILAFFAVLTRQVGILLIIPVGLHIIRNRKYTALPTILFPLLAYLSYLVIMYLSTGNALAGIYSEKHFVAGVSLRKIFDVFVFSKSLAIPAHIHGLLGSAIDRAWFILFCASIYSVWKMNKDWFYFALPMGLIPAMTVSLMAFTRYILVVFPMFIAVANWSYPTQREKWFYLIVFVFLGLQILFLIRHINFIWVA